MPVLEIHTSHLIYGDGEVATANPKKVYVDWTRHIQGVRVERPQSKSFDVLPGETLSLFSGARTTTIDNTTVFSILLNPVKSGVYRIVQTAGTAPGFRTARTYNPTGVNLTLNVNNNATLEMSQSSGNFMAQVGDSVFIPGVSTGDTLGPFNPMNEGLWSVIAASPTKIVLRRMTGESFVGVSEEVVPTAASQFQIFSSTGVQAGDTMEISGGFSSVTRKSFVVSMVTSNWIEFTSTEPLPLEIGIIPGATGISFYTDAKRFVRVEVDQEAIVRLNGDVGSSIKLSPRAVGDPDTTAFFELWGTIWSLEVINRSTVSIMTVNHISAE